MYTPKAKVLLIDDDDIYRYIARKVLESTGCVEDIHICSSGAEALDCLKENRNNSDALPDIILLDLNMPVMNGWEFLDVFDDLKPTLLKNIQVFIVTSSMDETDREYSSLYTCVSGFITKPFVREKILQIFSAALAKI